MKIKLTLSGLILLLILLAGGFSAWRSPGLLADPGEIRLVVASLPGTLDWNRSSAPSDVNYPVILAMMRGLTRLDQQGRAQPDLASSWEVRLGPGRNPQMILTFHLAQRCWSDGKTPLQAQDFVYGWRRAALGVDGGEMEVVAGVAELNRARDADPELPRATLRRLVEAIGIQALDPLTLQVTLCSPRTEFLQRLAQVYVFYPAPSQDLQGLDEGAIRSYFDQPRAGKPLVLGRYRPVRWDHLRGLLRLERNPFGQAEPAALERNAIAQAEPAAPERNAIAQAVPAAPERNAIAQAKPAAPERVTFYQSALESVLYARGKADFLQVQDPRDLWTPAADLLHRPLLSTVWLGFDTTRVPLALRQAIAWGLDRPRLLAGVLPRARVAFGLLPHDLDLPGAVAPGDALAQGFPTLDRARARRWLAGSGHDPRERLLLLVAKDGLVPGEALARAIQEQLGELGLSVEIVASSQFSQDLETLKPQLFIRRTGADYNHPNSFFVPQAGNGSNGARWKGLEGGAAMAELEDLLRQGAAQSDPERMRVLYSRAQEDLLGRWVVLVPLYYPDRYFRRKPWLHGLSFDAYNTLDLRAVTLERR